VIGAEVYWMGLPDMGLFAEKNLEMKLVDVIREAKPDVIISHNSTSEYHPDHVAVNQAVFKAALISSLANVKSSFPAIPATPVVYEMDAWITRNFVPTEYVDITGAWKLKLKMLEAHKCQIDWLRRRDKLDMATFIGLKSRMAGYQSGVKYAEGFRLAANFPIVKPGRMLP
jgi:N-acetylglucosamine malate deacetylase 1